jgi:hypothetical protein
MSNMICAAVILMLIVSYSLAQDQFCNVRCDVDAQCGGECGRCVITSDNGRVCLGLSGCGDHCNSDSDCDKVCAQCVNGACGGLPCQAECEKSTWCGEDCGECIPSAFNINQTLCTHVCGAPCMSANNCGSPCPLCSDDGICTNGAAFSAGEVAGIAIAIAVVGGVVICPLVVYLVACWLVETHSSSKANCRIAAACIPVGIIVFGLSFGLSLGLSPSICCAP